MILWDFGLCWNPTRGSADFGSLGAALRSKILTPHSFRNQWPAQDIYLRKNGWDVFRSSPGIPCDLKEIILKFHRKPGWREWPSQVPTRPLAVGSGLGGLSKCAEKPYERFTPAIPPYVPAH